MEKDKRGINEVCEKRQEKCQVRLQVARRFREKNAKHEPFVNNYLWKIVTCSFHFRTCTRIISVLASTATA